MHVLAFFCNFPLLLSSKSIPKTIHLPRFTFYTLLQLLSTIAIYHCSSMELGSILDFLENKTILVTGAAGFLSKILVEKILRTQPNVKKLYLLLRADDEKSANQRLQNEIIVKDLFRVVKQKMGVGNFNALITGKVKMVTGDITCEDMNIKKGPLKEELLQHLDVIINLAATTNFDERYDVSLNLNTLGAKNVVDFAKKCTNLKVLVHVSTAYVSGERGGLIQESSYRLGQTLNGEPGLDIEEEKRVMEKKLRELQAQGVSDEVAKLTMKDMGIERARKYGWPNVYVFTKALGEMLVMEHKGDLPVVIIRPSIVTSTYKEPFPGWVEGIRTIDSLAVGYGKGRLTCFVGDPQSVLDVIPGDMVVNALLVAMVAHASRPGETMIYHVGSSVRNPIKGEILHETAYSYFSKHPYINKEGKPVIVGHCKVLGSMESFRSYIALRYLLPLKGLQYANTAFCQYFKGMYMDLKRQITFVLRLVDIYRPYLFFKGIFDDINTERLRLAAREGNVETDIFYFDPKAINWEDYFLNTHIPGIVKYVLK
ncbi:hypothetical protein V2J09_020961 [Rumex salicifolius]